MARIGVIVHQPLQGKLFSREDRLRLESLGDAVWTESHSPLDAGAAAALLRGCQVAIGSWQTPYPTAELLAACPDLRLWEHAAGTVKHMFGPHIPSTLTIASCKTAIADCVAEVTYAQIVIGLRGLLANAAANRQGPVSAPSNPRVLYGSTIGVIGASQVGLRTLALLRPSGARLLLYDPYVTQAAAVALGATLAADLADMCGCCDAVTLHAPDIPECRHMLGAREFQAMRDDTVFVNTARGRGVDEAALIAELENGRLFAFLDVTDPEPAAADSPFRRLPNVLLTSHFAGPQSPNIGRQAVDDVARFLRGEAPLCVVTAADLARTA